MEQLNVCKEKFIQIVQESDMFLIGLGEEVENGFPSDELQLLYNKLAELLNGKNYFIVSQNENDGIWDTNLDPGRIAAPYSKDEIIDENGNDSQWVKYTKWLSGSLNRKLCIIELGVLLSNPNAIRWPSERIVMLNLKSHLLRINEKIPQLPTELGERGVSIPYNPLYFFDAL